MNQRIEEFEAEPVMVKEYKALNMPASVDGLNDLAKYGWHIAFILEEKEEMILEREVPKENEG